MASLGQPPSLKKRDASSTREEDELIITPLGAGNEVGRSCVYMSYKGKIVLVCFELIIISHLLSGYKYNLTYGGLIVLVVIFLFSSGWQFDCGIHPAYSGMAALPYFDEIDPSTIDVLLITQYVFLSFFLSKIFR